MDDIERIRQKYLPQKIKVLMVGESPPQSGEFFYTGDDLTDKTQEAFAWLFMDVALDCTTHEDFLNFFKKSGFYLDDLCLEPVNGITDDVIRNQVRDTWVSSLAQRMKEYDPQAIIFILKGARKQFEAAVERAGLSHIPRYHIPYPAFSEQNKEGYIRELVGALIDIFEFDKFLKDEEIAQRSKIPTAQDFRDKLNSIFSTASTSFVNIVAGDLHRAVGGYPNKNHRMPLCCREMRETMKAGDVIMYEPPSGEGSTFHIRYKLPRK